MPRPIPKPPRSVNQLIIRKERYAKWFSLITEEANEATLTSLCEQRGIKHQALSLKQKQDLLLKSEQM